VSASPDGARSPADDGVLDVPVRVYLRPIALPVSLGYTGLMVGGALLGTFHLGLLPVSQQHTVGLMLAVFVPGMQLIACVMAFLGRDTPVATEMGILAFAWLASGISLLRSPPGSASAAYGVLSIAAGVALISPILATSMTRLVPALVLTTAAVHLLLTGAYSVSHLTGVERAAGAVGWVLAAVALYGSVAFQLEDAKGVELLPIFRRNQQQITIRGEQRPLDDVDRAPGVRKRF
jgi:succinate-acetate transporter protein